jgi:hypothetical protein
VSLLGGYRFLSFADDLRIREDLESLEPATLGTIIVVNDHFGTRNQFHGGEIGMETRVSSGNLSLSVLAALSVGNLHRSVTIDGSTEVTAPGFPPVTNPGGLLALSSNSGTYLSDELVLVPEIGFTLGLQLNPRWRATAGYNLMLLPGVVRPGDQIDLNVNPNLLPPVTPGGPALPGFVQHESSLWAQRASVGLEYRY